MPAYGCIPDQNMREAEGWDRANVSLPGLQLQLLQAVANATAANGGTVVLVIENGEVARKGCVYVPVMVCENTSGVYPARISVAVNGSPDALPRWRKGVHIHDARNSQCSVHNAL